MPYRPLLLATLFRAIAPNTAIPSTSFPFAVKLKPSEVVWFSFIVYRNRKHRDRVNAKVMKDPRLAKYMNPKAMPLDGKRVIFGGFEVIVSH